MLTIARSNVKVCVLTAFGRFRKQLTTPPRLFSSEDSVHDTNIIALCMCSGTLPAVSPVALCTGSNREGNTAAGRAHCQTREEVAHERQKDRCMCGKAALIGWMTRTPAVHHRLSRNPLSDDASSLRERSRTFGESRDARCCRARGGMPAVAWPREAMATRGNAAPAAMRGWPPRMQPRVSIFYPML